MKYLSRRIIVTCVIFVSVLMSVEAAVAGPVSDHGQLSVSGTQLVDTNGDAIQLRGMSTHALTARWLDGGNIPFGDAPGLYATKETIQWTRDSWGANVIRAAVYSEGWGIADPRNWQYENPIRELDASGPYLDADYLQNTIEMIDWAIELDIYIIVDWHVLEDADPNIYKDDAELFFTTISSTYPNSPNVIYEIVNEPNRRMELTQDSLDSNGGTIEYTDTIDYIVSWDNHIVPYANDIIPIIRNNSPAAIAIVGTPMWDQNLMDAANAPLNFSNVMYSLHFYACTHTQSLRDTAQSAYDAGLPIFVTEWGTTDASGGAGYCPDEAEIWIEFLNDKNISWVNWALSGKDEPVSVFTPNLDPAFSANLVLGNDGKVTVAYDAILTENLTDTGNLVKCLMLDGCDKLVANNGELNLSNTTTIDLATLNGSPANATYSLLGNANGQATIQGAIVTFNAANDFDGGSFTYTITVDGETSPAGNITVVLTDGLTCDWQLTRDTDRWNGHWDSQLLLQNKGGEAISGWSVELTVGAENRLGSAWWSNPNFWNSVPNTDGTTTYTVVDSGWNANIPAGGSVSAAIPGWVTSSGPDASPQAWEPGFVDHYRADLASTGGDCGIDVITLDFVRLTPEYGDISILDSEKSFIELEWFNHTGDNVYLQDEHGTQFPLTPTQWGAALDVSANKVVGRLLQWRDNTNLDLSPGTHTWVLTNGVEISKPYVFTVADVWAENSCSHIEVVNQSAYLWLGEFSVTNTTTVTANANNFQMVIDYDQVENGPFERTLTPAVASNHTIQKLHDLKFIMELQDNETIAAGETKTYLFSGMGTDRSPSVSCMTLN